jgi:hypothetical protein
MNLSEAQVAEFYRQGYAHTFEPLGDDCLLELGRERLAPA